MDFFPDILTRYIESHSTPEDPQLAALNRETHLKHQLPQMVSGHQQGLLLELFSHMLQPQQILEIGTFTGYSAICMAKGLADGGKLHTIDINNELEAITAKYYGLTGVSDRIVQYFGNAVDIIPTIKGTFDMVFIDADKQNYERYFDLIIDRVPTGGFIIADNVLWSGRVAEAKHDKDTAALHAFNEKVQADDRVTNLLLSVRDGLMLMRKK